MPVKNCTVEVGEVFYSVRFELVTEMSRAYVDSCDCCGENDPDILTQVTVVSIFEIRGRGRKISPDDAIYGVIKEIIESDKRIVLCERCLS